MAKRVDRYASNLFAIDLAAIEDVLRDANSALTDKVESEVVRAEEMFSDGKYPNLQDAVAQYGRLKGIHKEVSAARLTDGRPFSDASKKVKDWFNTFENRLDEMEVRIKAIIDQIASADTDRQTDEGRMIGQNVFGYPVVTIRAGAEQNPRIMHVPTAWEVEQVDAESVDLEALRPYFTEHALAIAARKHLEKTGNHSLRGVSYRRVTVL